MAAMQLKEIIYELKVREAIQRRCMMSILKATDKTFWEEHEKLCRTRSDIELMNKTLNTLLTMKIEQNKVAPSPKTFAERQADDMFADELINEYERQQNEEQ